jgi:uncharacterized repeat protein (TIGR01451 family)
MRRSCAIFAALAWLALAAPAGALVTLGATAQPSGSQDSCASHLEVQPTDYAGSYAVPPGGGAITAWQTATGLLDQPGSLLTLVILRPASTHNSYTVVGSDTETFSNSLPSNSVVSFPVNPPIQTLPGDRLALYDPNTFAARPACHFHGASTLDDIFYGPLPQPGQSFSPTLAFAGFALDVSATLDNDVDASVSAGAGPGNATVGNLAELTATITNAGPATGPINLIDSVPAGLTIDSATAGEGSCVVSGQTVTCSITGLAAGQSAPVAILVTPTAPGQYSHAATITVTGFTDPTTADNAASATLTVAPAPTSGGGGTSGGGSGTSGGGSGTGSTTAKCTVPPLTGTPLPIAKQVLQLLGCTVGKTRKASSKKVGKGLVITTNPGAGHILAAGTRVNLTVSSGPPKKRRPRRGHHYTLRRDGSVPSRPASPYRRTRCHTSPSS